MIYEWQYEDEQEILLRTFLRHQEFSKRLLAEVKFHGGHLSVNGIERTVREWIKKGDTIRVMVPDEGEHETTVPSYEPISILFEDEHFLIIDKPAGYASIPSRQQPDSSIANRVKGYYKKQGYADQVIHIVTRLDRDTTGVMLFAKNAYTHARMDRQLRNKKLEKIYYAILSNGNPLPEKHGFIDAPIGRTETSIIDRMVHPDGKDALTEYWVEETFEEGSLVRIQLHTGRTHQVRVHMTHAAAPLLGDTLYGGPTDPLIQRQALHCKVLRFIHPFTKEEMIIESAFPPDFEAWMADQRGGDKNGETIRV